MPVYFIDTSFWIALLNKADADHARALARRAYAASLSATFLTTEAILWEMANALSHRAARAKAASVYRRCLQDATIETLRFSEQFNDDAIALFESRLDKDWSLTDCLSFVTMQRRGLSQALTADHHFIQAGFEALLLREPPAR
jgi:predicted nucleic acid-binding protein